MVHNLTGKSEIGKVSSAVCNPTVIFTYNRTLLTLQGALRVTARDYLKYSSTSSKNLEKNDNSRYGTNNEL